MRIVLFPVISSRFVPAAPSINFVRAFVHRVLDVDPEAVFYLVLPDETVDKSGWQYGEEIHLPRTHIVKVPMYRSQFDDLHLMTREFWELFNERVGGLWFDAILNERPALAGPLLRLSSFHIESKSRHPTVVNRNQIVLKSDWFGSGAIDEMMETVGSWAVPTVYQSPHQMVEAHAMARRYLQPAQMRRLQDHSHVVPLGIDCDDVDATNMVERSQKHPQITINYSHKLFLEQKFIESLALMDSVFAGGRDVGLQIVTGSSPSKLSFLKDARRFRYMHTVGRASRQVFLREMAKAHLFVSNSVYEDFSATVVEMMYTGLIPVLPDRPWARYLVPDGYPYLFRDSAEAQAMVRYVVDNHEQISLEWVSTIQEDIRARFDLKNIAVDLYELMRRYRAEDLEAQKVSGPMVEVVDQVWAELPDVFGIPEIAQLVRVHARNMDLEKEAESKSTSKFMFVDQLLRRHGAGLVDLGTLHPTWQRRP